MILMDRDAQTKGAEQVRRLLSDAQGFVGMGELKKFLQKNKVPVKQWSPRFDCVLLTEDEARKIRVYVTEMSSAEINEIIRQRKEGAA